MADISKIKLPDNSVVNIKDARITGVDSTPTSGSANVVESGGIKEAIMESAGEVIIGTQTAATGNWTGVSKLATASDMKSGYRFTYWLPYNGSGNATLTLTFQDGTTKAINCYIRGASRLTTHIPAGNKIDFCYLENASVAGTKYTGAWIDPGYWDGNTYDRIYSNYERRFIYSTATPLYRYKICGYNNGKIVPLVVTNQTSGTIVDKTPVTVGLDPYAGLVIYNTTTNITSISSAIGSLYNELTAYNYSQYTFNDNVPAYKDVYLKGTIGEDGLFYLDTSTHNSWYVFAPNRESDGEYNSVFESGSYYMFVGPTYSSENYFQLKYNNPVYFFNGERLISLEDSKSGEIEESTEFLYRKSPSLTQGYYSAKEIKGKTLVWNQALDFSNGRYYGSRVDDYIELSIASGTTYASFGLMGEGFPTSRNHKIFCSCLAKADVASDAVRIQFFNTTGPERYVQKSISLTTTWQRYSNIWTVPDYDNSNVIGSSQLRYTSSTPSVANKFYLKDVMAIDLTLMFGAGNEPSTVEEFESMFPLPYYDYNPGELISFNATGIQTVGFNQWDEEWEQGKINTSNGQNQASTTQVRSKNYIKVIANREYFLSCAYLLNKNASHVGLAFYDNEKSFVGLGDGNNSVFTIPSNCSFLRFWTSGDYGGTYKNDICINLSDESFNGQYEPYKTSTLSLNVPSMTSGGVQIFPDGMRSAGDVYDEAIVDSDGYARKVVRRIGRVDLGSLDWVQATTSVAGKYRFRSSSITDAKSEFQAVTAKYVEVESTFYATDTGYIASEGRFIIYDAALATATGDAFKTAVTGVYAYYELATPVEYTLDNPIFVGTEYYSGGIQKVLPENTSEPTTAPFRGKFGYRHYSYAEKQNKLTFDTIPTANSTNVVTSGGVYAALPSALTAEEIQDIWNAIFVGGLL